MYYRFYNSQNPMSRSGYAMFSNKEESVTNYGKYAFQYDGTNGVEFEGLAEEIVEALNEYDDFPGIVDIHEYCKEMEVSIEDFVNSMNPKDIVANAGIFDNEAMLVWLWETVLERNNVKALLTHDGAIVFDKNLIHQVENEWL